MKIKRRTLVFLIRTLLYLLGISFTLLLVYWYFFTQFFVISSYDIVGVSDEDKHVIIEKLTTESNKKTLGMALHNKILSYSNSLIVSTVQSVVTEASYVDVRPSNLHTVHIQVTSFAPLFRISETEALTKDGIIFSTNADIHNLPRITVASSTIKTIEVKGLPRKELIRNEKSIPSEFLLSLESLSSKISKVIFPIDSIYIESDGDVTMFNETKTSKILFLEEIDYKKAWSTLVSAIDTDPLKSKLQTEKDKLEYIDSRYGNKVFYRFSDMPFQNGNNTAIIDHHATSTEVSTTTVQSPH